MMILLLAVMLLSSCSSNRGPVSITPDLRQSKTAASDKVDYPVHEGFVNDYTGTLTQEWKIKTIQIVSRLEKETSCEIAVAIIDKLDGIPIEEYAVGLYNQWSVGKKEKDNGVLLFVAMEDRELRIEVDYGLEGAITDLKAKGIIEDIIVPRFKENDYDLGAYNGFLKLQIKYIRPRGNRQLPMLKWIKAHQKKDLLILSLFY